MPKNISVFCSSSNTVDAAYFEAAEELGRLIAQRRHTLLFGGAKVGLMGHVAQTARQNGGKIIGVLPKGLVEMGGVFEECNELIITRDLREQKAVMAARSDAFAGLAGGFGTLEEMMERLALKQLGFHNKAIVFINTKQVYQPLFNFFEHLYREGFADSSCRELYYVAPNARSAIDWLEKNL